MSSFLVGSKEPAIEESSRGPPCRSKPDEEGMPFLNFGHAAGDPISHCENTMEAAQAGLDGGMNSVEIDVCMSRDGVLFLWHDCNMYDSLSMLRRLGKFAPNPECLPYHHPTTYDKQPHELDFVTIQQRYGYKKVYDSSERLPYEVPSLRSFLQKFGTLEQIRRIYVDVKVSDQQLVEAFMQKLLSLAGELRVQGKIMIGFMSRDLFEYANALPVVQESSAQMILDIGLTLEEIGGSSYKSSLREADDILETALAHSDSIGYFDKLKIGYHLFRGVADLTVHAMWNLKRLYEEQMEKRQPMKHAQDLCIPYVSLGITPFPEILSHHLYEKTMSRAVENRRSSGYPSKIIAWTINDEDLLRWLSTSGVDGVITDKPSPLKKILG